MTNVDFDAWSEYLGDPPFAMAILDRIVQWSKTRDLRSIAWTSPVRELPTATFARRLAAVWRDLEVNGSIC